MKLLSIAYFLGVWKQRCPTNEVKWTSWFVRRSLRKKLNAAFKAIINGQGDKISIKERKTARISVVMNKWLDFQGEDNSASYLHRYCSIIVDGADWSASGREGIVMSTEDMRGKVMKVRVIELLEHYKPNLLYLFTMTEKHETGANNIVETHTGS